MNIRCPYCGGPVYSWSHVITEDEFIQCENRDERGPCGAQWNGDGELLLPPISERDSSDEGA